MSWIEIEPAASGPRVSDNRPSDELGSARGVLLGVVLAAPLWILLAVAVACCLL